MNRLKDAAPRKLAEHMPLLLGGSQRDAYITALFVAVARLADTPEIAISAEAIRAAQRGFTQGSQVIFFRKSDRHLIEVMRVLHADGY
jgi:plasmid stabilization system protein ParE